LLLVEGRRRRFCRLFLLKLCGGAIAIDRSEEGEESGMGAVHVTKYFTRPYWG
jgi:hypothetical protein